MTEAVAEKAVCENCGVDVREGTSFCYNCGSSVSEKAPDAAPADLEKTVKIETNGADAEAGAEPAESREEKLSKAAAARKKARVAPRKTVEYTWEPVEDTRLPLLAAAAIAILVAVVVGVMVFWK